MESIEVVARWTRAGRFEPTKFFWQGRAYPVESSGRSWEDGDGLHILCMAHGGQVFELLFQLNPAGWLLRPPVSAHGMV